MVEPFLNWKGYRKCLSNETLEKSESTIRDIAQLTPSIFNFPFVWLHICDIPASGSGVYSAVRSKQGFSKDRVIGSKSLGLKNGW